MCQSAFHLSISKYQINAPHSQVFNNISITITSPGSSRVKLIAMTIDDMLSEGLHPGALVPLILLRSMLPGVLGRLLHLLASLLVTLSARTLAVTADVDRVMSESSMMTTRAMIVNNDFCTPKECLVPHGSPADAGL